MILHTECLVIGGGPAGYGAALAAAKRGVRVLLVERYGFLGGMGTIASLSSFINYHHEGRRDLSDGVYRRLVRRLTAAGGAYRGKEPHVDFFDLEELKFELEQSLITAGARILYHCTFDSIERQAKQTITRFVGKGGEVLVHSGYVVDATGDADVFVKAGAPVTLGKNGYGHLAQPMSLIVQLAGFNPAKYEQAGFEVDSQGRASESGGWSREILEARRKGLWSIPRDRIAMWWSAPKDASHVFVNGTRIQGLLGCNPESLAQAEIEGRRQAREVADFFRRYVPGFQQSYLLETGPQIGVRETRRIIGRYTLTEEDVLLGKIPDDTVVRCSYPMDLHSPTGNTTSLNFDSSIHYGIPYRCMVAEGYPNLIAAGRCISADHQSSGSFRVMATCVSIGEAAGTAIGICHEWGGALTDVDGAAVRRRMDKVAGTPLTESLLPEALPSESMASIPALSTEISPVS